jgi:large subunit ribosomal protein L25
MANMTEKTSVEVAPRSEFGKNANRRLRAKGKIPANVYGMDADPFAVSVDPRRVGDVLRLESGHNTIFKLTIEGGKQSRDVMIREMQRDPVTDGLVHVDFVRIDATKELHVKVPIRIVGLAEGVKNEGGFLDFIHREITVACLPINIPEHLDVDVSDLHLNQHVSFSDLSVGDGVKILDDPETIIAVISITKAEEEETPAEGEDDTEGVVTADAEPKDTDGDAPESKG